MKHYTIEQLDTLHNDNQKALDIAMSKINTEEKTLEEQRQLHHDRSPKYKIFITEEGLEKDLTREDIVELLYNDIATVTFTKADGTERVMECTLLQEVLNEHIPELKGDDIVKGVKANGERMLEMPTLKDFPDEMYERKIQNPHLVAVWDIPSNGWRSFKLDSVKSISIPTT
jgi:hypothetical protein